MTYSTRLWQWLRRTWEAHRSGGDTGPATWFDHVSFWLCRKGFLRSPEEVFYYRDMRWEWRFWRFTEDSRRHDHLVDPRHPSAQHWWRQREATAEDCLPKSADPEHVGRASAVQRAMRRWRR